MVVEMDFSTVINRADQNMEKRFCKNFNEPELFQFKGPEKFILILKKKLDKKYPI